jgi:hypothetical protein
MGAGVLRAVAGGVLSLYPKAWRERYGEEVADLVASRPVRLRTVADLAGDAWLHHRRIPGARPLRLPLPAVLVAGISGLCLLWISGVRDMAILQGVWAEAARGGSLAGELHGTATTMFASAGAMAVLSLAQLNPAVRAAGAVLSVGTAALVARTVLRRALEDPVMLPERTQLGRAPF